MLIEIPDPPEILYLRSHGWDRVRDQHVAAFGVCSVCGGRNHLEVHHVRPYHLFPELELDQQNLLTLCRVHHFWFGHLGDWQSWNPEVRADCEVWREKIERRVR